MKIAAIGDLHTRATAREQLQAVLHSIPGEVDVLVLAGDLTDNGLPAEAEILAEELQGMDLQVIAVLGNHDHEGDAQEEISSLLVQAGVCILDGTVHQIEHVGFVGTKGFCGGFDGLLIQPFGERALKTFINASIEEAVRLENAMARLDCERRVAVTHYAPIKATLEGEPQELFPFLGSGRLANALDRQKVDLILHGHAHHGSPFGQTPGGIPVYNVCRFVQERHNGQNFCLFDL